MVMFGKKLLCGAIIILSAGAVSAQNKPACLGSKDVVSPDGALTAHITRGGRGNCGESKVEILQEDGHLQLTADYESSDGEHGSGIIMAAWSADSRYFAYSLVNSDDHAPWHFRIDFFRRDTNKLRPLSVAAPGIAITQPGFNFTGDNALEVIGDKGAATPVNLGGK